MFTSVTINSNGYLQFDGPDSAAGDGTDFDEYLRNWRIAVFGTDLTLFTSSAGVYVDSDRPDQFTVRWQGESKATSGPVNASVTLRSDGSVILQYGSGNQGLNPVVGLFGGSTARLLLSTHHGRSQLNNAASVQIHPLATGGFADIGAYEFQGDATDKTPPQVVRAHVTDLRDGLAHTVVIEFSEPINSIDAQAPANYSWDLNGDGLFGDVTGARVNLSWSQLAGHQIDNDGRYLIAVKVRDPIGLEDVAVTALRVDNVVPRFGSLAISQPRVQPGQNVQVSGAIVEPGARDALKVSVGWGDGSVSQVALAAGQRQFAVTHAYEMPTTSAREIVYLIRVTVQDKSQQPVAGTLAVVVARATSIPADFDGDQDVDSVDLQQILAGWTGSLDPGTGGRTRQDGDLDGDQDVDSADLSEFFIAWTGSANSDGGSQNPSLRSITVDAAFGRRIAWL